MSVLYSIFPASIHIFPCSRIGRPILEIYISLSQISECRNWETEHYNSILEITDSFMGIHKWETDIYIGYPPALHLQCISPNPLNLQVSALVDTQTHTENHFNNLGSCITEKYPCPRFYLL
jgi:hypothetical protein